MRLSPLERLKHRFENENIDLCKVKGLIVSTAFTKGGTGKSTASYNLCVIGALLGMDVFGVDADDQRNFEDWGADRRDAEIEPEIRIEAKTGRLIGKFIKDRAPQYNLTVVDAGGFSSVELREVCKLAHFLMAPVVASRFNFNTFDQIEKVVRDANLDRATPVKVHMFLSRGSTNAAHKFTKHKKTQEAIDQYHKLLKEDGIEEDLFILMNTQVRQREAHMEAEENGNGIVELGINATTEKAAEEACELFYEVIMRAIGKYNG